MLTLQPDKRFKKYIISLLNISRRIRDWGEIMVEGNEVLTSLCCDCTSKISYPTTNLKKLYFLYSVLLCSISKLCYIVNISSIHYSWLCSSHRWLCNSHRRLCSSHRKLCSSLKKLSSSLKKLSGMFKKLSGMLKKLSGMFKKLCYSLKKLSGVLKKLYKPEKGLRKSEYMYIFSKIKLIIY